MPPRFCNQCVLPETYPGVNFDSQGVCRFCREFKPRKPLGEARFLERICQRKGEKYDCLLGISGGKDSCYVAYLARKRCNLRPLAVFYDFPFIRDLARDNSRRVCEALGIDLHVVKTSNNLEFDLLRNHFMSVSGTQTTWGQCIFCHYGIDAVFYNLGIAHKIPFLLSGKTANEEWWNPGSRLALLMRRVRQLPLSEKARFGYYQFKAFRNLVDQRRQFAIPGNRPLSAYSRPQLPENGPELLHVFDYFPWNQREIERVLKAETGWVKPDRKLTWRYDCILEPMLDFTYLREFGISTVGLYVSGLVREGSLTREEALQMRAEAEAPEVLRQSAQNVFDFLKLPAKDQEAFFRGGMPLGCCCLQPHPA